MTWKFMYGVCSRVAELYVFVWYFWKSISSWICELVY